MDAIEYDAMMIRHQAAITTGMLGWEGLVHVVAPEPELLKASLDVARSRSLPRVESLDAMLARMG